MRIDTGSMMQGQLRTDIPDLQAITEGLVMGQADFSAALGQAVEGNLFVQNADNCFADIEKTVVSADNILEASVIEIPSEEHVYADEYTGEPENTVSVASDEERKLQPETADSEDKAKAFYQNVLDSGLAAEMQTAVFMEHAPPDEEVFTDVSEESEVCEAVSEIIQSAGSPVRNEEKTETAYHVENSVQGVVLPAGKEPEAGDKVTAEVSDGNAFQTRNEVKVQNGFEEQSENRVKTETEFSAKETPEFTPEQDVRPKEVLKPEKNDRSSAPQGSAGKTGSEETVPVTAELQNNGNMKTEADAEVLRGTEMKEAPQAVTDAKVTVKPEMMVKTETGVEVKMTGNYETKAETDVRAEAVISEKPEIKAEPEIRTEAKVTEKPEIKEEPVIRAEAKVTEEPEMKAEPDTTANAKETEKNEIKSEPEIRAVAKITVKTEITADPVIRAEAKVTGKPETKENPEIRAEAKTAETPEIKVEPEVRAEAKVTEAHEIDAKPEIRAEAKVTETPEIKAKPVIGAEAKITETPEIKAEPVIAAE
ncbi:MAG: hypothetical protein J6P89_10245, partial [Oscillospiraceae bacterium]|nr:hypothetical protein [Oscillospiraceae bacterium]